MCPPATSQTILDLLSGDGMDRDDLDLIWHLVISDHHQNLALSVEHLRDSDLAQAVMIIEALRTFSVDTPGNRF